MKVIKTLLTNDEDKDIHAGEAYVVWTQLVARYDTVELIDIFKNLANDAELKLIFENGLNQVVLPQIDKLEQFMQKYQIPMPPRPPKGVGFSVNMGIARDQGMFRIVFSLSQSALSIHTKAINICTNNFLLKMFSDFLHEEINIYKLLLKFGQSKGWVYNAPKYRDSKSVKPS